MSTMINREQLRSAIEAGSVTVIDVAPPAAYARSHLPRAINIVGGHSDEQLRAALPNPGASIVTYSGDDRCTRATELAERLRALGYRDVRPYPGGLQDWNSAGFPIETASADEDVTTGDTAPTRLIVLPDGPYQATGPLEIMRAVGEPIPANDPVYLCRCGRSASKPFCDGSHARTEWKDSA